MAGVIEEARNLERDGARDLLLRISRDFAKNPVAGARMIRDLLLSNGELFVSTGLELIATEQPDTPGQRFLSTVFLSSNLIISQLCEPEIFDREHAVALARRLEPAGPIPGRANRGVVPLPRPVTGKP